MNIRIYDNGGETFDRYTVIYLDYPESQGFAARGMSENPYHAQGFGQMCMAQDGPHLGQEIDFSDLPPDCQSIVKSDLGG